MVLLGPKERMLCAIVRNYPESIASPRSSCPLAFHPYSRGAMPFQGKAQRRRFGQFLAQPLQGSTINSPVMDR
jgi:hypothetical protein